MAKRGLTPVVAIILMVVVAVAAALAFYAWFKAFQSQTQVKVSSASTATVEQTRAPLIVTKLNATNSSVGGGATIKNLSTSSQTISKFLYRDLSAGATGLTSVSTMAVAISGSGSTHTITAPATWNCTSGDLYYIEIRTDKGSTSSDTIRCV